VSLSVSEIFAARGEAGFREMERSVTLAAEVTSETVVSTGGGWMARPELRDVWPGAIRVWLVVDPATAAVRLARERRTRPLLAGPDPEAALETLLVDRLPAYRLSEVHVLTEDRAPAEVVDEICRELTGRRRAPGTS
jgi:shikimate kinase